ncbi:MAG: hypothetical protein WCK26_03295 [Candidatus Saccharibacteria bacterium]|jgi:hypothetical protein
MTEKLKDKKAPKGYPELAQIAVDLVLAEARPEGPRTTGRIVIDRGLTDADRQFLSKCGVDFKRPPSSRL